MTPTYYKYKRLFDIGMTRQEIADMHGVSRAAVTVTLWRNETPERAEKYRAKQRTGQLLPPSFDPKPGRVLQAILTMRRDGKTFAQIAQATSLSRNSVAGLVRRHGLNP